VSSNNYAVYGKRFSLEGTFHVLRMTGYRSEPPLDYEEVECATKATSSELRALIAIARTVQDVDFGNGLRGIYGECDGFVFCVVPDREESGVTEDQWRTQLENSDPEDIF
jgi:hypothetical protein